MNTPSASQPVQDTLSHAGGCICGDVRFTAVGEPLRTVVCHCTFCQRLTGSAYLVEPIFRRENVEFSSIPKVYDLTSSGSGKTVRVNFCDRCGTTVFLTFERFPDILGLCGGTFDDPSWFSGKRGNCSHIFTRSAQAGVVLPAGVHIYSEHVSQLDGTPNAPSVLASPQPVDR